MKKKNCGTNTIDRSMMMMVRRDQPKYMLCVRHTPKRHKQKKNTDDGATHLNSLEKYTIARATHNNQLINHIMNYIHRKMSEEGERERKRKTGR